MHDDNAAPDLPQRSEITFRSERMRPITARCHALEGANIHHASSLVVIDATLDWPELRHRIAATVIAEPFAALFPDLQAEADSGPVCRRLAERMGSGQPLDFAEILLAGVLSMELRLRKKLNLLEEVSFARILAPHDPAYRRIAWEAHRVPLSKRIGRAVIDGIGALLGSSMAEAEFVQRRRILDAYADRQRLTSSTALLLREARRRGFPVQLSTGQVLEVGNGTRRQVFNSSISPGTDIGPARLARDKSITARTLRAAGIPAPVNIPVAGRPRLLRAAQRLGYPLAVKPLQSHSGRGVSVDIRSEEELIEAVAYARAEARDLLIEQFVEGAEYRMLVVGRKLVAVVRRDFPSVTGDGRSTILQLVEATNADPRRNRRELHPVRLGPEVDRTLRHAGLARDSVVEAGRDVVLSKVSNVSLGGVPVDVTDEVHPDNAALAVLAAQTLGLDVAGVDFISADISRSWREIPSAVIEVNARPGIHIHFWPSVGKQRDVSREILDLYFPGGASARIPTYVVGGDRSTGPVARLLAKTLQDCGLRVGLGIGSRGYIDGAAIELPKSSSSASAHVLLREPSLEGLVIASSLRRAARRGLVIDRCDGAILLPRRHEQDVGLFDQGVDILVRAAAGPVVAAVSDARQILAAGRIGRQRLVVMDSAYQALETLDWVAAGGAAVVRRWRVAGSFAEFHAGGKLIAEMPLPSCARMSMSQIEAGMYAFALLCATGMNVPARIPTETEDVT